MANEQVSLSNPVTITSDAKQRVAYDLMQTIGTKWYDTDNKEPKTREYWLKLYTQCYKATIGSSLKSILKDD